MTWIRRFSKQALLFSLVLVMMVAAGCATRGYPDQKIGKLDVPSSGLRDQGRPITLENQTDIQSLDERGRYREQMPQALRDQGSTHMQAIVSDLDGRIPHLQVNGSVAMTENVFFEFAGHRLSKETMATLDKLVLQLGETPFAAIHLIGHIDREGGKVFNFYLGHRRVEAVKAYLVQKGIDPNKSIITLDEQLSNASNQDGSGQTQNRVEIKVLQFPLEISTEPS